MHLYIFIYEMNSRRSILSEQTGIVICRIDSSISTGITVDISYFLGKMDG
jgi:hypothetical protein